MFRKLCLVFIVCSCSPRETSKPDSVESISQQPPSEVVQAIETQFPGARSYRTAIDSLLVRLDRIGISSEDILWGQSTCVDDITNTKNKGIHPEIKGPFTFGGLGGLPFTGVTGIEAFAHHVPHDGTALLFLGPHIGYTSTEGWGKILRHGQEHPSSCCGALVAALDMLRKGEIKPSTPGDEDYQEQTIQQLALLHRDSILIAKEPLVEFTRITYKEALNRMGHYVAKVKERHFKYAVVVVGVIINTDYEYDDYLWIHHIAVKEIATDKWVDGV
jgi:hypothetical protein